MYDIYLSQEKEESTSSWYRRSVKSMTESLRKLPEWMMSNDFGLPYENGLEIIAKRILADELGARIRKDMRESELDNQIAVYSK